MKTFIFVVMVLIGAIACRSTKTLPEKAVDIETQDSVEYETSMFGTNTNTNEYSHASSIRPSKNK